MAKSFENNPFRSGDFIYDPRVERHSHLDMLRAFAIVCVVIDNGSAPAMQYGIHNVLFTQEWVIQVLWMICGISWSLSKSSLPVYVLRLVLYIVLGGGLNLLAWWYKGMDWRNDLAGVLYQLWFVVALILYASLTVCVKPLLRHVALTRIDTPSAPVDAGELAFGVSDVGSNPHTGDVLPPVPERTQSKIIDMFDSEERRAMNNVFGVLLALMLAMLILAGTGASVETSSMQPFLYDLLGNSSRPWTQGSGLDGRELCGELWSMFGGLVLVAAGAKMLRSPRTAPWLSWLVIQYVYLNRMFFLPMLFGQNACGADRFFVGFEFFLIGLVASNMGLRHASKLRFYLDNYWIIMLGCNAMLWGPTWNRRMDLHPSHDIIVLIRIHVSELMFVVLFLAGGSFVFPERAWPPLLRTWISRLGLMLFLVHQAVYMVTPQPFDWIILFGMLPLVFLAPTLSRGPAEQPDGFSSWPLSSWPLSVRSTQSARSERSGTMEMTDFRAGKVVATNGHGDMASS